MSIVYNGTSLSKIIYNGTTFYSISYGGFTYCVSCTYSSQSCGSSCSSSLSSSGCARCSASFRLTCNSACTTSLGNVIAPSSLRASVMRNSASIIGMHKLTEHRAEWLRNMSEELVNWQESYETYYGNPDVPLETQEEIKRIYEEIKKSFDEDIFVLEEELKEAFPNMTDYKIDYEEGAVNVY